VPLLCSMGFDCRNGDDSPKSVSTKYSLPLTRIPLHTVDRMKEAVLRPCEKPSHSDYSSTTTTN
jgi:hypothetical protein